MCSDVYFVCNDRLPMIDYYFLWSQETRNKNQKVTTFIQKIYNFWPRPLITFRGRPLYWGDFLGCKYSTVLTDFIYEICHVMSESANVDCSGERLTCVPKSSGFWNTFWYNIMVKTCNIPWGTPYSWETTWDASMNFTSLYHYTIRKYVSKSWTFWDASQSFSWAIYISWAVTATTKTSQFLFIKCHLKVM
jgi:hypothetical protein